MAQVIGRAEIEVGANTQNVGKELKVGVERSEGAATTAAVAVGTAIGTAVASGIESAFSAVGDTFAAALDFGAAEAKLEATLGLTAEDSARFGELAGQVWAEGYGDGIGNVTTAVDAVVSSIDGMRTASNDAVEDMTEKTLNLEKAFGVEVGRSAQIAGQMIREGLAKDGVQAMDLLTASLQRVPAAVREDLLDAVDEYGPFMKTIGLTGQEAMSLLVKAAEDGAYGIDKTGDAIKEFGIRATDLSEATTTAYDTIGVDTQKMTNALLAGGEQGSAAFKQIVDGLRGIKDPGEQAAAAIALFGTPIEDLSVSEIPKFLDQMSATEDTLGDVSGAADQFGQSLMDSTSVSLTSFLRTLQSVFIDIMERRVLPVVVSVAEFLKTNLGPAVTSATDAFRASINWISQFVTWMEENKTIIIAVGSLIAAVFIPHLIALGIASITNMAFAIGNWVAYNAAVLVAAATHSFQIAKMIAGWVLMGTQALLNAARIATAWLIAMGPIGLVIAAVVGLVTLIVVYFDEIVAAITAAWEWVKEATAAAWEWIVQRFRDAGQWISDVWESIKKAAEAAWQWVLDVVEAAVDFMVWLFMNFTIPGLIIKHWDTIKRVTKEAFDAVVEFIRGAIARIGSWIDGLGNIVSRIGQFFADAFNQVGRWITGIVDWVRGLPGQISQAFGRLGEIIMAPFKAGFNAIARFWNSTVGSLSFTVPSWVPFIGGSGFSMPKIPELADGGIAMGPTMALIGEGSEPEAVLPLSKLDAIMGGGTGKDGKNGITIIVNVTAGMIADRIGLERQLTQVLTNLRRQGKLASVL